MKFGRLFLLIMAMVVLSKPFIPVFFYLVNIRQITEYFCVNKDKPMLHCDGKCYLAQKIAEARAKDKSDHAQTNFVDYSILQIDWIDSFSLNLVHPPVFAGHTNGYLSSKYKFNFYSTTFMPPQAA